MAEYVWRHDLRGESDRLRLMSDLLDPSSRFHLLRTGVTAGWHCLEIGAGNGSLSRWLAQRVGPTGNVVATDIRTDLMDGIGGNLAVRKFDVVHDEPPDAPYDLVALRALLHHLPERRAVVGKLARWLKPGGWLFIQEPDFYPTWTVEPPSQKHFWQQFIRWAASHHIDYYVGRKIPAWLQAEGLRDIYAEGHAILYNGARHSPNGGITASSKSRTSYKAKAACPRRRSRSFSPLIATRPIGRRRSRLRRRRRGVPATRQRARRRTQPQ